MKSLEHVHVYLWVVTEHKRDTEEKWSNIRRQVLFILHLLNRRNSNKYVNMFIFSLFQQLLCQSANLYIFVAYFMSDKLFWLYMSYLLENFREKKYQYHEKYRVVKCQSWISYFSVISCQVWQNKKLQYCDRNFGSGLFRTNTRGCYRYVSGGKMSKHGNFVIVELPTLNFITT